MLEAVAFGEELNAGYELEELAVRNERCDANNNNNNNNSNRRSVKGRGKEERRRRRRERARRRLRARIELPPSFADSELCRASAEVLR